MLAFQMEKARECGMDRVRVLHIAPGANRALRRVTSPALARFGDDAFSVFSSLLCEPPNFISRTSESLFRPLMSKVNERAWADYLSDRYAFLSDDALGD